MRKMLDKKDIEKIIDEHGGSGGSSVSVTVSDVTNKVDSITIDGETKAVAYNTVEGVAGESYWHDLTINGHNYLIPQPVSGESEDDYWKTITIGNVTKNTSAGTPDGRTIVINEPEQNLRKGGAKAAAEPEMATAIGGWLEKGGTTVNPVLYKQAIAGFWNDDMQLPYWELAGQMVWNDLLAAIYGSVPATSARAQIEIHVYQNNVEVQGWDNVQASYSPGTGAITVNNAMGPDRISITQEAGMQSNQFRCKVYPADSSTAITFDSEDEVKITLNGLVVEPDVYHALDGRFLPIDGETIVLNASNELQAAVQVPSVDGKTILEGQDGLETAIGGYTEETPGQYEVFINNEDNNGYVTTSEPAFDYVGDTAALLLELGLETTLGLRANQFTSTNDYNVIVKKNGVTVWEMLNGNVAYNYMGPGSTAAILVKAASGNDRVSINTQGTQTDAFRIKVYAGSSSAMTFEATDVVTLYIQGPDPLSPASTVYYPIDGRFVPIDGVSITLDANNRLQAQGSAPANMVTTDSNQTISGEKTFSAGVYVADSKGLYFGNGNACIEGTSNTMYTPGSISLYVRDYAGNWYNTLYFEGGSGSSGIGSLYVDNPAKKTDLGTSSSPWNKLYLQDEIQIGSTTLNEAQLQALLALLNQ